MENIADNQRRLSLVPWLVVVAALGLSSLGWWHNLGWAAPGFIIDNWFPLFGLIAFSTMWAHYAVDFLQRLITIKPDSFYLPVTRFVVFFAILMHPGLLALNLWQYGAGLPPQSFFEYVGSSLKWGIVIGIAAWLAFMAFELHRWFRERPWFRWVLIANSAAMLSIVIHAMYLAGPQGWFRALWYFYGISLIIFLAREYYDYRMAKYKQSAEAILSS